MGSLILECPHCGAEKIGFTITCETIASSPPPMHVRYQSMLICTACEGAVVGVFDRSGGVIYPQNSSTPGNCPADPRKFQWQLTATYPKPEPSKCPMYTPPELKRLFLQASNALKRGDPDASGAMSRKVVDVSTQLLLAEQSKDYGTINARIEALAANGTLTPDLKDWAHQVRLGGNDASHDLDVKAGLKLHQ